MIAFRKQLVSCGEGEGQASLQKWDVQIELGTQGYDTGRKKSRSVYSVPSFKKSMIGTLAGDLSC